MSVSNSIAKLSFQAVNAGASIAKSFRGYPSRSPAHSSPTVPACVRAVVAMAFGLSPVCAFASSESSQGPVACPAALPSNLASLASAVAPGDLHDGVTIEGAVGPAEVSDAQVQASRREQASFARILNERSAVAVPTSAILALSPQQRAELDADPASEEAVPKIGTAIDFGRAVDFAGVDSVGLQPGGATLHGGVVGPADQDILVWEAALVLPEAKAVRLEFTGLALAAGVELYVYNEDGQVWGPYGGRGPDGSGEFWSPSTFGDTLRVHLRANDAAALAASRFTIARVMHLGARVAPLQDRIREQYAVGPMPDDVGFCGAQVPDCTQNAVCWIDANAALAAPSNAVAHLQFVVGSSAYICTGAFLAQSGNAPQQPYFMTAHHCFSTQASASSLEAYFKFRTSACSNGTCPSTGSAPRVNGSTLIATGASPSQADFTFLRLSGFPATSGIRLLGWSSALVPEAAQVTHMGHPAGAPLAFSYRRFRVNNASLPHVANWPEPTFLYSGLASASSDWTGATAGGSSGGPLLLQLADGTVPFIGQLSGAAYAQEPLNECDPNGVSTVDGAFRSSFPSVRRYLYDRIFRSGFEAP